VTAGPCPVKMLVRPSATDCSLFFLPVLLRKLWSIEALFVLPPKESQPANSVFKGPLFPRCGNLIVENQFTPGQLRWRGVREDQPHGRIRSGDVLAEGGLPVAGR
jgi:hypothetical protein